MKELFLETKSLFIYSLWLISKEPSSRGMNHTALSKFVPDPKKALRYLDRHSLIIAVDPSKKYPFYVPTKRGLKLASLYEEHCKKVALHDQLQKPRR